MSCEIDGYNSVEDTTMPRARKEHQCCACRETIRVGDIYARTFVVFEGEVETYKHCLRCNAIFEAIAKQQRSDDNLETWEYGVAWKLDCGHDWDEVFESEPPPEVARLAFLTPDEMQSELAPKAQQQGT